MVRPVDLLQADPPQLRLPAKAVSEKIPGFKTSTTFFSSLRTNLRLHYDIPSPMSTPPSMRGSTPSLPPPSPLASAIIPGGDEHHDTDAAETPLITVDPLADVPPLNTCLATTSDDKLAALKLVADSVAQQRQFASRVLIFHPLNLAVFAVVLGIVAQLVFKYRSSGDAGWFGADAALVGTTWAGVAMAALVGVRIVTGKYLDEAETIKWDFVGGMPTGNANGGVVQNGSHVRNRSGSGPNARDVFVSKFGDEVIGALVLEWVVGEGKMRRKKVGRGSIRAWTVKLRYRGKGVGTGLLEEAAKLVEERGGDGIEFNEEHANSKRFLWQVYNSPFETREQKARDLLDSIVDARTPQTKRR